MGSEIVFCRGVGSLRLYGFRASVLVFQVNFKASQDLELFVGHEFSLLTTWALGFVQELVFGEQSLGSFKP